MLSSTLSSCIFQFMIVQLSVVRNSLICMQPNWLVSDSTYSTHLTLYILNIWIAASMSALLTSYIYSCTGFEYVEYNANVLYSRSNTSLDSLLYIWT